jgi:hypothetical protein
VNALGPFSLAVHRFFLGIPQAAETGRTCCRNGGRRRIEVTRMTTSNWTFFTAWCGCSRPAIVRVFRWHPTDLWRRPEPRR